MRAHYSLAFILCAPAALHWSISIARAADPLALTAMTPANNATQISPDTPLKITFAAAPILGKGNIQLIDAANDSVVDTIDVAAKTRIQSIGGLTNFNYYPIIITGNEAAIYFPNHKMDYHKTYYVKVDAGAFVDKSGAAFAGFADAKAWQFATRAAAPAPGLQKITIAQDGTGDFATVQAALDFIPDGNKTPTTLYIKAGTYTEMIFFTNKNNLTLLGEDRKKTIIAYPDNDRFNPNSRPPNAAGTPSGGYRRGMLRASKVTDLTVANLTLHDTTPVGGSQAEAIILDGTRDAHAILTNVDLYSFQDTLQINGQAYISHCYIEGDVDYMWGTGPCFFENCEAKSLTSNHYYTQIRNTAANHGYIYKDCTFSGIAGVTGGILSRIDPGRFPASEVVLLNCTLTSAVGAAAWRFDMNTQSPNVHFWEYNSHDPDGKPVDVSKRFAASKQLTQPDDKDAIANYGDAKWVLGGQWTPALAPIITSAPASTAARSGEKVTFNVEVAAVPDATYQWTKDGVEIAGATKAAYIIESAKSSDAGKYAVVVTNTNGKATSGAGSLQIKP